MSYVVHDRPRVCNPVEADALKTVKSVRHLGVREDYGENSGRRGRGLDLAGGGGLTDTKPVVERAPR
ncbi:hypothetical protein A7982_13288 [Minicystis rosea]|nr:hypothetical protein A7982_13288 [Minicystis rosea]